MNQSNLKQITLCVVFLLTTTATFSLNLNHIKNKIIKKIKIAKESYETISGSIEVPEDHTNINSKFFQLPVYIIKSINNSPSEPVFFLSGGPGGSNITSTKNTLLLRNHDFICVGYRGVDGPVILNSKKLTKAAGGLNHELLSDESISNFKTAITNYLKEVESSGVNLNHFTILDVIDDINYVSTKLGYEKINLLSNSYGTRLAILYDFRYPNNVNRSVMVGVNPPGHFIWWPSKTVQILEIYDSLYKEQSFRFKGQGNIMDAMTKAFSSIPKKWAFIKLDSDKIKVGIFAFMFQKDYSVMAFDAVYRAAYKRDYSGLCLIQKMYSYFSSKNIWGDAFIKGLPVDYEKGFNYIAALKAEISPLGPNASLLLWGATPNDFSITIPDYYKTLHDSNTETLLISGDLDVSTPADYAKEELLPHLKNGKQLILTHMSHNDLDAGQLENYRKTVANYFDNGTVSNSSFDFDPIRFKPKRKLNRIAKLLYPLLIFIK